MLLLLDNHDSFTFNLVQYFLQLGAEVEVVASDAIDLAGIRALAPERLVISPGPGTPDDAGVSMQAIRELSGTLPILGVCLGHQAIGQAFGAKVIRGGRPMHGVASSLRHDGGTLFSGRAQGLQVGRYHSLVLEPASLPPCLRACAWSEDDGAIQAVEHTEHATFGVQFHPESILTEGGHALLEAFLQLPAGGRAGASTLRRACAGSYVQ